MKAILLTDGKAGHENQSKAFALALGLDFAIVPVKFKSPFHKAFSYLFDFLGVHTLSLLEFQNAGEMPEKPDIAIGTGSGTFYAAKALAAKGAKSGVILYPRGYRLSGFDCILAPSFDSPAKRPNIVEIPANLVANDAAFYEKGVAAFRERYSGSVDDLACVIVGGPNKCSTMTVEWMKKQLDAIFAENPSAALCVTTSRRTPPDVEALVDSYPWAYKLIYSKDHFNPIPAFVNLAKRLYVTAESTGMLSEACTCGTARVSVLDNLKPGGHKFRRFVELLRAGGHVDGNRKIDLSAQIEKAKRLLASQQN